MAETTLKAALKAFAEDQGFARMGVAIAEELHPEREQLFDWLEQGRHGQMQWMATSADVRVDPRHEGMLKGAASVVVLATPYARSESPMGAKPGRVARYAQGRDYHNVVGKRTEKLAKYLRERGHRSRAAVDSKPVFERAWAERAGLGFIGKNCCLIVPGLGSHVFLSAVITIAPLEPDPPIERRCGSCTACLDACPTQAFSGVRQLDARRCISYLTIEHRGPIDEELREPMGQWLFGCDVCQDVCPYNQTSPVDPAQTQPFSADPRWTTTDAADLLTMTQQAFDSWAQGSPVKRAKWEGLARNAAIVLGNHGNKRHLPILEQTVDKHEEEMVRDAAAWAVEQIAGR